MTLKCGIIGLPNVGKSTLFNAVTSSNNAVAANYPFCTIEPNSGIVEVPDSRLIKLAGLASSAKIIPTYIEFVDIAGLVKGASKGEGLGNKFLTHIREVDALIHVVRCFEDENINHVHKEVNPIHDIDIIETELLLSDLESLQKRSLQKRISNLTKKIKGDDKESKEKLKIMSEALKLIEEGKPARILLKNYDSEELKWLDLLTLKPILYVCNVDEDSINTGNKFTNAVAEKIGEKNFIIISSKIEAEIALLEDINEKNEFLQSLGLEQTGLNKVIKSAYDLLNLKSFFTIGPKEAHAWTFIEGASAPQTAGIIHSDFEKGFIRAEVISYEDFVLCTNEAKAKELGKMRLEGKEYLVKDGDIIHFRFNV